MSGNVLWNKFKKKEETPHTYLSELAELGGSNGSCILAAMFRRFRWPRARRHHVHVCRCRWLQTITCDLVYFFLFIGPGPCTRADVNSNLTYCVVCKFHAARQTYGTRRDSTQQCHITLISPRRMRADDTKLQSAKPRGQCSQTMSNCEKDPTIPFIRSIIFEYSRRIFARVRTNSHVIFSTVSCLKVTQGSRLII